MPTNKRYLSRSVIHYEKQSDIRTNLLVYMDAGRGLLELRSLYLVPVEDRIHSEYCKKCDICFCQKPFKNFCRVEIAR